MDPSLSVLQKRQQLQQQLFMLQAADRFQPSRANTATTGQLQIVWKQPTLSGGDKTENSLLTTNGSNTRAATSPRRSFTQARNKRASEYMVQRRKQEQQKKLVQRQYKLEQQQNVHQQQNTPTKQRSVPQRYQGTGQQPQTTTRKDEVALPSQISFASLTTAPSSPKNFFEEVGSLETKLVKEDKQQQQQQQDEKRVKEDKQQQQPQQVDKNESFSSMVSDLTEATAFVRHRRGDQQQEEGEPSTNSQQRRSSGLFGGILGRLLVRQQELIEEEGEENAERRTRVPMEVKFPVTPRRCTSQPDMTTKPSLSTGRRSPRRGSAKAGGTRQHRRNEPRIRDDKLIREILQAEKPRTNAGREGKESDQETVPAETSDSSPITPQRARPAGQKQPQEDRERGHKTRQAEPRNSSRRRKSRSSSKGRRSSSRSKKQQGSRSPMRARTDNDAGAMVQQESKAVRNASFSAPQRHVREQQQPFSSQSCHERGNAQKRRRSKKKKNPNESSGAVSLDGNMHCNMRHCTSDGALADQKRGALEASASNNHTTEKGPPKGVDNDDNKGCKHGSHDTKLRQAEDFLETLFAA